MPELLVVHDLGHFSPELAEHVGTVLKNYVDGVALARLGKARMAGADAHERSMHGKGDTSSAAAASSSAAAASASSPAALSTGSKGKAPVSKKNKRVAPQLPPLHGAATEHMDEAESPRRMTSAAAPAVRPPGIGLASEDTSGPPASSPSRSSHHHEKRPALWVTDVSKRTVVWQASEHVLRAAGVPKVVHVSRDSRIKVFPAAEVGLSARE